MKEKEAYMTTKEVLQYLGISHTTLWHWVKNGRLHPIKANEALIKSPLLFTKEEIYAIKPPKSQATA